MFTEGEAAGCPAQPGSQDHPLSAGEKAIILSYLVHHSTDLQHLPSYSLLSFLIFLFAYPYLEPLGGEVSACLRPLCRVLA